MKRITLLLLSLAVAAACSDRPMTAPVAGPERNAVVAPDARPEMGTQSMSMPTCRSGYAIADRNGKWVCESPDGDTYFP